MKNEEIEIIETYYSKGFIPIKRVFIKDAAHPLFTDLPTGVLEKTSHLVCMVNYKTGEKLKVPLSNKESLERAEKLIDRVYKPTSFKIHLTCKIFPEDPENNLKTDNFYEDFKKHNPEWQFSKDSVNKFNLYKIIKDKNEVDKEVDRLDEIFINNSLSNKVSIVIMSRAVYGLNEHSINFTSHSVDVKPEYSRTKISGTRKKKLASALRLAKMANVQAVKLNYYREGLEDFFKGKGKKHLLTKNEIKTFKQTLRSEGKRSEKEIQDISSRLGQLEIGKTKNEEISNKLAKMTTYKENTIKENMVVAQKQRGRGIHSTSGLVEKFHKIDRFYREIYEEILKS